MLKHVGSSPSKLTKLLQQCDEILLYTREVDHRRLYGVFRKFSCVRHVPFINYQVGDFMVSSDFRVCNIHTMLIDNNMAC